MIEDPERDGRLDVFHRIAKDNEIYTVYSLAEKYGLSDGQARTLISIHGPNRKKLDKVIADQTFD